MDLSQLFGQIVNEDAVKEATRFKTVPTGGYNVQCEPGEFKQGDDEKTPSTFQRWYSRVMAPIVVINEDNEERKLGNTFFNISPEVRRVTKGRKMGEMDAASKLWGQVVKALRSIDAIAESATNRDVWKALAKYPVYIFVIEFFVVAGAGAGGADQWITISGENAAEMKAKYLAQGLEPQNMVTSISAYKEEAEEEAETSA